MCKSPISNKASDVESDTKHFTVIDLTDATEHVVVELQPPESNPTPPPAPSPEPIPSWDISSQEDTTSKKVSPLVTGLLLFNVMIGAGVFNAPQQLAIVGVAGGTGIYGVFAGFTLLTLEFLARSADKASVYDFGELAGRSFGVCGSRAVDVLTIVLCAGSMVSYIVTIGSSLADLIAEWMDTSGLLSQYRFTALVVTGVVMLPLVLIRDFGHLGFVAFFALGSVFTITIFVSVVDPELTSARGSLDMFRQDFFQALGGIAFTLLCQHAALHAYRAMTPMNIHSWHTAISVAVGCGISICLWMGVLGYVRCGPDVASEILDCYRISQVGTQVMHLLLIGHLCLYMPVEFLVARHSFIKIIGSDVKKMALVPYVLLTICMLGCIYGLACITDDFGVILDLTGGVGGSFVGFVFPGAIYLKTVGREQGLVLHCMACVTVGFGLFVLMGTLYGISIKL